MLKAGTMTETTELTAPELECLLSWMGDQFDDDESGGDQPSAPLYFPNFGKLALADIAPIESGLRLVFVNRAWPDRALVVFLWLHNAAALHSPIPADVAHAQRAVVLTSAVN